MNRIPTMEEMRNALDNRNGKTLQDKFASSTVAICGLGGLGSNIAVALARTGVGRLILIDFDKVDISNLHRQQYKASQIGVFKTEALAANLKEIAPYLSVITHTRQIDENNFNELLCNADIICEAFDGAEAKAMLVNSVLKKLPERYLIAASGMAGIDSSNVVKTRRITDHFYLCGDEASDVEDNIGLMSSRVMLCAAHQAHMALRILAEKYEA